MISHDNYTWITDATVDVTQMLTPEKYGTLRCLSLLPLSHVAAQMVDLILAVRIGMTVFFADPSALQGNLVKFLKAARPYARNYLGLLLCLFQEFGKNWKKELLRLVHRLLDLRERLQTGQKEWQLRAHLQRLTEGRCLEDGESQKN